MATETIRRPDPAGSTGAGHLSGGITRVVDSISDLAILAFASWTLLYHLGLIFHLHTNPLLVVWVVTLPLGIWWLLRSRAGTPGEGGNVGAEGAEGAASVGRPAGNTRLIVVAVVLAVGAAALIGSDRSALWLLGWLLALAAVVIGLISVLRATTSVLGSEDEPISLSATLLVLGAAVGLGGFSVFVLHTDADDVYYINRAAWVADHGTIPVRDTIFSDQVLPAQRGAGVPVSAIETFQGAIAHALHLQGGTLAYLVTPPVGVFLAVWAVWRLIRRWAPRRQLLCMAVAVAYLLWAATDIHNVGPFFIDRMQQGKAILVSLLVPMLYLYLTQWAREGGRRNAVLLVAAGVTGIGFSSSATFLVPLICAAAAFPLLVRRDWVRAAGSMLPAGYPLVVGLVVHFTYAAVDTAGSTYTGEAAARLVFGPSWFGALGWVATLAAVWIVRPGPNRWVTAGIGAVLVVIVAPGVFALMNDVTGAHDVLWRAIWMVPLPALVGLLAAVPLPARLHLLWPVPAVAVLAVIIAAGAPETTSHGPVCYNTISSAPTWRYFKEPLQQARAIMRIDHRTGPVLAPSEIMRALAVTTTKVHPVNPRNSYLGAVVEPAAQRKARLLLSKFIGGKGRGSVTKVRDALAELEVSIVCLPPTWTHRRMLVKQAGYVQPAKITGPLVCYQPAAGASG